MTIEKARAATIRAAGIWGQFRRDRSIPTRTLYFIYSGGRIVYIGHTGNLKQRLARHRSGLGVPIEKVEYLLIDGNNCGWLEMVATWELMPSLDRRYVPAIIRCRNRRAGIE